MKIFFSLITSLLINIQSDYEITRIHVSTRLPYNNYFQYDQPLFDFSSTYLDVETLTLFKCFHKVHFEYNTCAFVSFDFLFKSVVGC